MQAVEGEGLGHGLLLTLHLDRDALLVELVFVHVVHHRDQGFVVANAPVVVGQFTVLQSDFALLQEDLEVHADESRPLEVAGLVDVVLQDGF